MIINHNLMANNAIRQMNINSSNASKSMEKLSSGLRINSAADDAAGLSISEKMKGQIRGLDQASSNAQDGISMVQTAEGALSETTSILQRMRELAVQGSNDTNTSDDRTAIQTEMNQLTSEINRIGNTTEFNTQKLLSGGTSGVTVNTTTAGAAAGTPGVAVGAVSSITNITGVAASGSDAAASANVGSMTINAASNGSAYNGYTITVKDSTSEGIAVDSTNKTIEISLDISNTPETDISNLTVTGVNTGDDNLFTFSGNGTSATTSLTGSTAGGSTASAGTPGSTTFTLDTALAAGETMSLGGQTITAYANSTEMGSDAYGIDLSSASSAAAQATAIRAMTFSGVTTGGSGTSISLTQTTAGTGNVSAPSITGAATAATAGVSNFDVKSLNAGDKVTIDGQVLNIATGGSAAQTAADLKTAIANNATLNAKYTATGTGDNVILTQQASHESAIPPVVSYGDASQGYSSNLQIGANTAQTLTVSISDMRAEALDISGSTAGASVTAKDGSVASYVSTASVTDGTSSTNTEFALDISTNGKATAAISVLDDAISTVSAERSKLGAVQNRLEHTINNLGTSSENLTSAQSRITDVDMAKEMSTFSKNNILSQAAQAMLAQANNQPQQVLQLLR